MMRIFDLVSFRGWRAFVPATAFMVLMTGCRAKQVVYVPQIEYRDSVVYVDRTQYDSVFVYERDSSSVMARHDTIFVERWRTKIKDKLVYKIDTIKETQIKIETKTEIVEVERKLTKFQEWKQNSFWFWFFATIIFIFALIRQLKKLKL